MANPVSVAWQKQDLAQLHSKADKSGSGSKISVNAAAGAGLGATLGLVVLLLGILWFLRRYKKKCKDSREAHASGERNALTEIQPEVSEEGDMAAKEEVEVQRALHGRGLRQMDSRGRSELEVPP